MIYTLTLNPTLDITYEVEEISLEKPVRAKVATETPGGKGINVSRVLKDMGVDSIAMALIGGYTGAEVLDLLHREGLILQVVKIKNETRTNIIILEKGGSREVVVRAPGPPVESDETETIKEMIFKMAKAPELMVVSGSLPPSVDEGIYRSLIETGKKRGTRFILDAAGKPLEEGVKSNPFLIKPNRAELEGLAGRELVDLEEILDFCRRLVDGGIEVVVVSMGSDGAAMVSEGGCWFGSGPVLMGDTVGAGDSMVAGLAMGIARSLSLEECFRMGLACALGAVMNDGPGLAVPRYYQKALGVVTIERKD